MEICDVNRFYGHAHIIKSYCNYPFDEPIPMAIQHGHGPTVPHDHFEEPLFDYWVYSEDVKKQAIKYLNISSSSVHVLGSPFAYLLRLVDYHPIPNDNRKGTIVFPSHSTPGMEISSKINEDYAEMLSGLPEEFCPITVSVHSHDIQNRQYQCFIDRGLEVITCGNHSPLQSNFLGNFLYFCRGKKYITSNEPKLSTACLYGIYLGLKFFMSGDYPNAEELLSNQEEILNSKYKEIVSDVEKRYLNYYNKEFRNNLQKEELSYEDEVVAHAKIAQNFTREKLIEPELYKEQFELARYHLGGEHLLSPVELRDY